MAQCDSNTPDTPSSPNSPATPPATLADIEAALDILTVSLAHAQSELSHAQSAVSSLLAQKSTLEAQLALHKPPQPARAPALTRVPSDLLAEIFRVRLADDPFTPWITSGVSRAWRSATLGAPLLWSRIRVGPLISPAGDIVRLWVERSGATCPLDIEFTLTADPPSEPVGAEVLRKNELRRDETQWSHVVMHYLAAQLHRWARFVFRCNYVVISVPALNFVAGSCSPSSPSPPSSSSSNSSGSGVVGAPLLEEFTVICEETGYQHETTATPWVWLPKSAAECPLPRLRILDIRNLPFSHDSVLLLKAGSSSSNNNSNGEGRGLRRLTLVNHDLDLRLDRALRILTSNTALTHLTLDLALADPILPIKLLRLPCLEYLDISGAAAHRLLAQLVVPRLRELGVTSTLDDFADVGIGEMLVRSGMGVGSVSRVGGEGLRVLRCASPQRYTYAFPRALLAHLPSLTTLELRSCSAYTGVLADLANTDISGAGGVVCPGLETLLLERVLSLRRHVPDLVRLVDARNPEVGGGAGAGSWGASGQGQGESGNGGSGDAAGEALGNGYGYGGHAPSHSNTNAGPDSAGLFTWSPPSSSNPNNLNFNSNNLHTNAGGVPGGSFGNVAGGGGVLSRLKNLTLIGHESDIDSDIRCWFEERIDCVSIVSE
ncbi:hypothetical protein BOTBODRAFT_181483 [Botryobasidium botryosum FD-172 SS1]|uniref:F-box domain-containing protein n=1 Tax=Botryobasidium botryosum (strain FD-172 SS1) TaxID=930990 RepID=A0A067LTX2_BOTB1|nr:hypothetical protein BOTBODRAFT_181483 [Botryobasidium botryosum FD-172 SS1]